ncbi:MAG: hypothetical protein J1G04_00730 [Clostridiales bacterium]|nr:hypothetical protein [Clostridiales bacterium]
MSGEDKEVVEPEAQESDRTEAAEKPIDDKSSEKIKKKKPKFVDDGRTVYSMEGLSKHKDKDSLDLSKKEKRALIKAAFAHYLPIFLGVIGCFSIAAIILYLWLH